MDRYYPARMFKTTTSRHHAGKCFNASVICDYKDCHIPLTPHFYLQPLCTKINTCYRGIVRPRTLPLDIVPAAKAPKPLFGCSAADGITLTCTILHSSAASALTSMSLNWRCHTADQWCNEVRQTL